jgi:hypothetical protein
MVHDDGSGRWFRTMVQDDGSGRSFSCCGRSWWFADRRPKSWIQNVDGSNLSVDQRRCTGCVAGMVSRRRMARVSLRGGRQETWRISVETSRVEKIVDGFFRGDWIGQPDGSGTWIVTSTGPGAFRLVDVEQRSIVWEQRRPPDSLSMPCFSADGRLISLPLGRGRDRTDIVVADAATGSMRVLAHLPFSVLFRASWIDNGSRRGFTTGVHHGGSPEARGGYPVCDLCCSSTPYVAARPHLLNPTS